MANPRANPKDIFRRRFHVLLGAMNEPGPIATALLNEGLIAEASMRRAIMNTTPDFERASTLLTAVMSVIKTDSNEPTMFIKMCKVLENFNETAHIAREMETEYYGGNPPPPPPSPPPPYRPQPVEVREPPARSVSFSIGDGEGEEMTDDLHTERHAEPRNVSQSDVLSVSASSQIGYWNASISVPLRGFWRLIDNHPDMTRLTALALVLGGGYALYKVVTFKYK